jgi:hypothetical protein
MCQTTRLRRRGRFLGVCYTAARRVSSSYRRCDLSHHSPFRGVGRAAEAGAVDALNYVVYLIAFLVVAYLLVQVWNTVVSL